MAQTRAGMHPEDVKSALRQRYGTLRALADGWQLDKSLISKVLRDPGRSIPTERRIAEALDVSPHAIWPDRWTEAGDPLPRSGVQRLSRPQPTETSQKRRAA